MKKKIVILLFLTVCCITHAEGQHYFGVKAGYGMGYGRLYAFSRPRIQNTTTWGLMSGGIMWKYYTHQKYVGGIGAEVEFLQKAYSYKLFRDGGGVSDSVYRRVYNTLFVPVLMQPHLNLANGKGRVFINLGVGIGYHFPNSREFMVAPGGEIYWTREYHNKLVRDNPLTYGIVGGLGFNMAFGRFEIMAEGRYHFNFGDVLRNRSKYPGDDPNDSRYQFMYSPVDAVHISVGLFYRIGERPETYVPGAAAQRRRMEKAEKRSLKKSQNGNNTTTESSTPDPEGRQ